MHRVIHIVTVRAVGNVPGRRHAGLLGIARVAVPVSVEIRVPRRERRGVDLRILIVRETVAVLVDLLEVADFGGGGVGGGVGIVAVQVVLHVSEWRRTGNERDQRIAESVAVRVAEPGGRIDRVVLVDLPVAVVVEAVADFRGAWERDDACVVTVGRVVDEAIGLLALHELGRAAVAVAVEIGVPRGHVDRVGVDIAVAVVVEAVADLDSTRMRGRVLVVAVRVVGDVLADRRAGVLRDERIAEAVLVLVGVIGRLDALVDLPVAVVVNVVAHLGLAGVDVLVLVGAVVRALRVAQRLHAALDTHDRITATESVAICILVPDGRVLGLVVHLPVAVVVRAVADFGRAGVGVRVGVVAVVRACDQEILPVAAVRDRLERIAMAITIGVEVPDLANGVVDAAVAVVVLGVADFGRARVDLAVDVVTVAGLPDVALGLGA